MRHLLDFACDGDACERELADEDLMLTYRTGSTERRAYACPCGAVTITVGRR